MNAADPALFPPREHEPPSGPNDPIRVVYHGTVLERYGVDLAVRAFARAREQEPRLHMALYGGGDFVEPVRAIASELRLSSDIFYMTGEHRPLDWIAEQIRSAHIGVAPNRDNQEDSVLPTKLLEYLAVGVPSVATRTRCISRFFDGSEVELVEVGDVEGMANAIVRLARDPKRRETLIENGHLWEQRYGWHVNKANLFRTVDELCARAAR
jgi:glycosyltransferase involved in cell wall biosynthesis